MLRLPALAVIVPVAAMAISGFGLADDAWQVTLVVYAAIAVPALAGMLFAALARRAGGGRRHAVVLAVLLRHDQFRGLGLQRHLSADLAGADACYVLALPFLEKTVLGDLFWTGALFGGAWLVQHGPALGRRAL